MLSTRATLVIMVDPLPSLISHFNTDFFNIQADIEKDMNGPPTDQRLVRTLVSEVVHPKTKRNVAQWKKEQKMRRK